jgi:tetratricopeptide (TPR) repeat protein
MMTVLKRFNSILSFVPILVVAISLNLYPALSYANGGGGGSGDSGGSSGSNNDNGQKKKKFVFKCFKGKIWDTGKKKCIKEKEAHNIDQDSIYTYGRNLARAGQYDDAIRVLLLAHDQSDPRVLNYLGFTNRKLGNMQKALGYYHAAVASNPDFTLVREYLGEAYIQLGQLEKAREQLTQIERICGANPCREYSILTKYIVESQLR